MQFIETNLNLTKDGFLRKQTHWTHKIQMEHLGFSEELTHRNTYVELN